MSTKMVQLRRIARLVNGGTPTSDEANWGGDVQWATPVDLARFDGSILSGTDRTLTPDGLRSGSNSVRAGSVILSTRAPIGYVVQTAGAMAFNQGCKGLEPRLGVEPRLVKYWLWANRDVLQSLGTGSTFMELSSDQLLSVQVPHSAPMEQRRIADFLDDQIARIDNIIAARERQAEILEELFLAQIVTVISGSELGPGVKRHSVAEWLPPIPDGWGFSTVSAFYQVQLGKMLNPKRSTGPTLRPYLRNANVHWFEISTTDMAEMSFEPHEHQRYLLKRGDLMICEGGAGVAEAAIWRGEIEECYYQKSLHRVRPTSYLPAEWLMYWLKLAKATGALESVGNLATIPHLTREQLMEWRIPVPPRIHSSTKSLDNHVVELEQVQKDLTRSKICLDDLKRSLITAAVSGEFDVSAADGSQVPLGSTTGVPAGRSMQPEEVSA